MKIWVVLLAFLFPLAAQAYDLNLSLDYKWIKPGTYMPELPPPYTPTNYLGINVDLDIWGPFYWDNTVHGETDGGQFRLIGWHYELGAKLWKIPYFEWLPVQVSIEHHSQHILDADDPYPHFPVYDSVNVRVYLWRSDKN